VINIHQLIGYINMKKQSKLLIIIIKNGQIEYLVAISG